MNDRPTAVRFGGLGGQGLVTLGAVLAEAGARAGLRVAASQHYGSRARGGATHADVILSAEEIDFPHVLHPDLLVVLAQDAYQIYRDGLAPKGVILADDFFVKVESRTGVRQFCIPATRLAMEQVGNKLSANFVMLGALAGYTGLIGRDDLAAATEDLVNPRFVEDNLKACDLGREQGLGLLREEGPWR